MTKRLQLALKYQSFFLSAYLGFSTLAAVGLALFVAISYGTENLLGSYPLTAFFAGYTFLTYGELPRSQKLLPFSKYYPVILSGQTILLLGMSFEFSDLGPAYWSLLPSLVGVMTLTRAWMLGHQEGHRLQSYLYMLVLFYGAFQVKSLMDPKMGENSFFFPVFGLWLLGISIVGRRLPLARPSSPWRRLFKSDEFSYGENSHEKDRFFFHDMVNHLHALGLKLSYRMSKGRGIEANEVPEFLHEVMALQTVMTDHFELKHKNLDHSWNYLPMREIRPLITSQTEIFFRDRFDQVHFRFEGVFAESFNHLGLKEASLPFAAFYRIYTNLIKNAAEAKSGHIDILFEGDHSHIYVTLKNDFKLVSGDHGLLNESLAMAIKERSSESVHYSGLGLAAIESMCRDHKGHFEFKIEDGYWISHFSLAYKEPLCSKDEFKGRLMGNAPKSGGPIAA